MGKETETSQPVVEADQDDALACECRTIKDCRRSTTVDETATMDPHHDRQVVGTANRSPHIEEQAVFGNRPTDRSQITWLWLLHAVRAVVQRRAQPYPWNGGLGCLPAQCAQRGRGIGNALEGKHAIGSAPFDFPTLQLQPDNTTVRHSRTGRAGKQHGDTCRLEQTYLQVPATHVRSPSRDS